MVLLKLTCRIDLIFHIRKQYFRLDSLLWIPAAYLIYDYVSLMGKSGAGIDPKTQLLN